MNCRHADWLGSARFSSTPSRTRYNDLAYAPFGEQYAAAGTTGVTNTSFAGNNEDTTTNLYDAYFREYGIQGRWPSPDPAGIAAANPANPQSWNRYAYVLNNPNNLIDPSGLAYWSENYWVGSFSGEVYCDQSGGCLKWDAAVQAWLSQLTGSGPFPDNGFGSLFGPDGNGGGPMPLQYGSGNAGRGGGNSVDDNAIALARALNATGIQSLTNPCVIAGFYAGSVLAGGGIAVGPESAATIRGVAVTYWPDALNVSQQALYRASQGAGANFILHLSQAYGKLEDAVSNVCRAH